jgi:hypothetical protein
MDLTQAIIAKSDQLNASDLISGPRTFTIAEVREGNQDQPCQVFLVEWPGRPFKPSKTVMRILVHAWGKETDDWPPGARMTLFRDPSAKWAGEEVGGIRVSHLSHITAQFKIALRESQKKSVLYTVDALPDAPTTPTPEPLTDAMIACCTSQEQLRLWYHEHLEQREAITARKAELDAETGADA